MKSIFFAVCGAPAGRGSSLWWQPVFGTVLTAFGIASQMIDLTRTATTTTLLAALHDPSNQSVWKTMDARYRPIVFGFARQLGLSQEDAADVAQQTLADFVRDYRAGKYERGKGRLSSWVMAIARHRVIDVQRARARRQEFRGASALEDLAAKQPNGETGSLVQLWEAEHERAIFNQAMTELVHDTKTSQNVLRAFQLYALGDVSAKVVAQKCDLSVAEVYRVKNRLTKSLRRIVTRLNEVYAEDG